jgi:hypothetical protein
MPVPPEDPNPKRCGVPTYGACPCPMAVLDNLPFFYLALGNLLVKNMAEF